MTRHLRPPSPFSPRALSDSDAGFDPVEDWLVDFDQAMESELAKSFGLGVEVAVPDATEPASCDIGKVSKDGSVSETCGFGLKEEVVEVKDGLLSQFSTSCGSDFDFKEEAEMLSGGLGGQLVSDQLPVSGTGDLALKEDVLEGVVDAEMGTLAAVDAEMNSDVSVKEEGGGGKGEGKNMDEESESSEDEEEDDVSNEVLSSSEEEGEEQMAKKDDESSEASSSSDEEEQRTKKHGVDVDMEALLEEGELMAGIDDDDEEEETPKGPIKSKHELEVLPPVPKIEVQLEPHHKALPVGMISAIMGERVIVEGSVQHNPLNEGSILWITESRIPLGIVDELFGPVKNPYYLVRYNSAEEVPAGICAGTSVSFVAEFADHILNMKELYAKGYDESGHIDEDQIDELEFSDDEKEAEYKRSLRLARRQTDRQHESTKPSGDKKRVQPRGSRFRKDMPPRIHDASTPAHRRDASTPPHRRDAPTQAYQSQHHFHLSDMAPAVADSTTRPLGPRNFSMSAPTMLPPVSINPATPSAVQLANHMGGCIINPSQQFLPQQPNVVWPRVFPPPPHPNMGVEGAAFAANIMQNILIGANQYQQYLQNQNFGGFPNGMHMSPPQFMLPSGMPANPMPFGGPPENPQFSPVSQLPMGQGNFGQLPHMAGDQGAPPGFPSTQGFGRLPPPHGDGNQPPTQFNSGQFNQGNSSFRGRRPQQRGGRHSPGRGGGGRFRK